MLSHCSVKKRGLLKYKLFLTLQNRQNDVIKVLMHNRQNDVIDAFIAQQVKMMYYCIKAIIDDIEALLHNSQKLDINSGLSLVKARSLMFITEDGKTYF